MRLAYGVVQYHGLRSTMPRERRGHGRLDHARGHRPRVGVGLLQRGAQAVRGEVCKLGGEVRAEEHGRRGRGRDPGEAGREHRQAEQEHDGWAAAPPEQARAAAGQVAGAEGLLYELAPARGVRLRGRRSQRLVGFAPAPLTPRAGPDAARLGVLGARPLGVFDKLAAARVVLLLVAGTVRARERWEAHALAAVARLGARAKVRVDRQAIVVGSARVGFAHALVLPERSALDSTHGKPVRRGPISWVSVNHAARRRRGEKAGRGDESAEEASHGPALRRSVRRVTEVAPPIYAPFGKGSV